MSGDITSCFLDNFLEEVYDLLVGIFQHVNNGGFKLLQIKLVEKNTDDMAINAASVVGAAFALSLMVLDWV